MEDITQDFLDGKLEKFVSTINDSDNEEDDSDIRMESRIKHELVDLLSKDDQCLIYKPSIDTKDRDEFELGCKIGFREIDPTEEVDFLRHLNMTQTLLNKISSHPVIEILKKMDPEKITIELIESLLPREKK